MEERTFFEAHENMAALDKDYEELGAESTDGKGEGENLLNFSATISCSVVLRLFYFYYSMKLLIVTLTCQ